MPTDNVRPAGIYDLPDADYRADPALSCSEARRILEAPAKYRHDRDARTEQHTAAFDFGKAAHTLVLGAGVDVVVIDADDWRGKAARDARDDAYDNGLIPILARDWAVVQAMRDAIQAHPIAGPLLDPDRGNPEQSLFWTDPRTGVPLRARLDWLPATPATGRLIIPDLKTTIDASARAFGKSAASYDYHMQASWYMAGAAQLLDIDPAFVFVVVEKSAPHLVHVMELDTDALAIGRDRMRRALDVFVECSRTGVWPGFGPDVEVASLPRYAQLQHDDEMESWLTNDTDREDF